MLTVVIPNMREDGRDLELSCCAYHADAIVRMSYSAIKAGESHVGAKCVFCSTYKLQQDKEAQ